VGKDPGPGVGGFHVAIGIRPNPLRGEVDGRLGDAPRLAGAAGAVGNEKARPEKPGRA